MRIFASRQCARVICGGAGEARVRGTCYAARARVTDVMVVTEVWVSMYPFSEAFCHVIKDWVCVVQIWILCHMLITGTWWWKYGWNLEKLESSQGGVKGKSNYDVIILLQVLFIRLYNLGIDNCVYHLFLPLCCSVKILPQVAGETVTESIIPVKDV